jgi:hypothetical protein
MAVVYMSECRWEDISDGMVFQFVESDGNVLAEVALMDSESNLWKFQVNLPERNRVDGVAPAAIVATQPAARKIAEAILLATIATR